MCEKLKLCWCFKTWSTLLSSGTNTCTFRNSCYWGNNHFICTSAFTILSNNRNASRIKRWTHTSKGHHGDLFFNSLDLSHWAIFEQYEKVQLLCHGSFVTLMNYCFDRVNRSVHQCFKYQGLGLYLTLFFRAGCPTTILFLHHFSPVQ